ncbi:MAG: DNA alkylation repair protein, partial [Candidatus Cloacimonadaceae bacterium]|nr:DNA alkylation repair protein [Candidatus Cloacimonadaceae bacterium]
MNHREQFIADLQALKNGARIPGAMWFFKTGPGQYGAGDQFWGLTVPQQRVISKKYWKILSIADLTELLIHPVHEIRLTTLMTMVLQYQKAREDSTRQPIVEAYLANVEYVNNWDLVDSSA